MQIIRLPRGDANQESTLKDLDHQVGIDDLSEMCNIINAFAVRQRAA